MEQYSSLKKNTNLKTNPSVTIRYTPISGANGAFHTDGIPAEEEGMLDFPIAKVPGATIKRMIAPDGKPSRTRYRVLEKRNGGTLILLELETGRTHQIRVHLSHIGCPVRGDFLYGEERPEEFPGCFALHSAMVELRHPLTGETLRLTSLPQWAGELDDSVLFMDFN